MLLAEAGTTTLRELVTTALFRSAGNGMGDTQCHRERQADLVTLPLQDQVKDLYQFLVVMRQITRRLL